MIEERFEEERIHLLHDLRAERCICLLLSEMLGDIAEEGMREGGVSLKDALCATSGILQNLALSLELTGHTVETWEGSSPG